MPKTTDPHARALLDQLRELLRMASECFAADDFYFDTEIAIRLPEVVSALQPFLGKPTDRTPFWNCVKAVDHHWPGLKLILTLDAMVDRATSIPQAPLAHLLSSVALLSPAAWQRTFVLLWKAESGNTFAEPPSDLTVCWRLLESRVSPAFKRCYANLKTDTARAFPLQVPKSVEELLGLAAFLDFHWQRAQWRERYMEAHEGLHLLLAALESEEYEEKRARVLENSEPFSAEARERALGAKRATKFRNEQKAARIGSGKRRKAAPR